jgi:hypothetical protein
MNIPTFTGKKIVDKDGHCHPEFQQYNDHLNQQMQANLSNDGFVIPANTTADINHIANPANPNGRQDGTIWYDSETHQWKGKSNGVVKVFTVT